MAQDEDLQELKEPQQEATDTEEEQEQEPEAVRLTAEEKEALEKQQALEKAEEELNFMRVALATFENDLKEGSEVLENAKAQNQQASSRLQDLSTALEQVKAEQTKATLALETAKHTRPFATLEPLPYPPDLRDLTLDLPTTKAIQEDFMQLLEKSLNQNDDWRQQIYLSLQGVHRILSSFQALKDLYAKAELLKPDLESGVNFASAQVDYVKTLIDDYNAYFDQFNAIMIRNNGMVVKNFDLVLEQIELAKKLLERVGKDADGVLAMKTMVQELLKKLESMDEVKLELVETNKKAHVYIQQID
ncbi:hypothetical protein [Helicobacter ailurogastricus]|uniref:hypothetical protein n=1 Tax=Helicobacter ailurogastricus TaxID=1578720 RepID=UPI00244D87FE|nr:hypothetical protein [Helicobacter ailurogastricus]GMB91861.1 hypothetical protein NHP190009_10340 [Helicobacter ailurogastricus]